MKYLSLGDTHVTKRIMIRPRAWIIHLLGGYTEAEKLDIAVKQTIGVVLPDLPAEYEPPKQTYFKTHIMARFMSEDELHDFHTAYSVATSRPNLPDDVKTYRREVIERMLTERDLAKFIQQYQEAKMPTTLNLHYGKKMEQLVRRIVREEMKHG